jgi:hypothetical protein
MKGRKSINLNNPFHNLKQKLQILLQNHQKTKNKKRKTKIWVITNWVHHSKKAQRQGIKYLKIYNSSKKNQSGYV